MVSAAILGGCKKNNIEKYDKQILGMWKWSECAGDPLKTPCEHHYDIYFTDGTWFTFKGCDPDVVNYQCDLTKASCINNGGEFSDTLSYLLIDHTTLVRQRHTDLFDKNSPVVSDSFKIETLNTCKLDKGGYLYLRSLNNTAAKYFGNYTSGQSFAYDKIVYNSTYSQCLPSNCD